MDELKFLRVDCDFSAEGLWDERGRMVSLEYVPISQPLQDRIRAWNEWYTCTAEPWSRSDRYDWDLHEATAVDIARCLARELPEWTIIAIDRRIGPDGLVRERVPFPGEEGGVPFRRWFQEWLAKER